MPIPNANAQAKACTVYYLLYNIFLKLNFNTFEPLQYLFHFLKFYFYFILFIIAYFNQ